MEAHHVKKQLSSTMSVTAGQVVEKLESLKTGPAKAIQRLVLDYEGAAVMATLDYDAAVLEARRAVDNARIVDLDLAAYVKACLLIAAVERIGAIAAYASLDRDNISKFAEHISGALVGHGGVGKALAARLEELRDSAEFARATRDGLVEAKVRAQHALASTMLRLRGSIDSARALLQMNGISIAKRRPGRKTKGVEPSKSTQSILTAVPTPPANAEAIDGPSTVVG